MRNDFAQRDGSPSGPGTAPTPNLNGDDTMDYATFKSLQALLFFGSAMGFCLWQLAVIRRMRREDARARAERVEPPGR